MPLIKLLELHEQLLVSLLGCIVLAKAISTVRRHKSIVMFLHCLIPLEIFLAIMFIETSCCLVAKSKPGGIYWALQSLFLLYATIAWIIIRCKMESKQR